MYNPYYALPVDTTLKVNAKYVVDGVEKDTVIVDLLSAEQIAYQVDKVEDMIVDEGALEFAYEGIRFYDLMRYSMATGNDAYLGERVSERNGKDNVDAALKSALSTRAGWYLPKPER